MADIIRHDKSKQVLGTAFPANQSTVNRVIEAAQHDDGRSEWLWLRLANGDLMLGVWPQGDLYFDIEGEVEKDYTNSLDATPTQTQHNGGNTMSSRFIGWQDPESDQVGTLEHLNLLAVEVTEEEAYEAGCDMDELADDMISDGDGTPIGSITCDGDTITVTTPSGSATVAI